LDALNYAGASPRVVQMKKFICREIMINEGGCDKEFEGEMPMAVAGQCGKHVSS